MRLLSISSNRPAGTTPLLSTVSHASCHPAEFDPQPPEQERRFGADDERWDIFLPDDDQLDPLPEPGDFWIEPEEHQGMPRAA